MKNKRADLTLTEVVKILLAVIGISILVFLAFKLFGIFSLTTTTQQARASLDGLVAKTESLEEGQQTNYIIESPKDWIIFIYYEDFPKTCEGKNCLCFCEEQDRIDCKTIGICHGFDERINFLLPILQNSIDLSVVPREIFISKKNKGITFYTEEKQISDQEILNEFLNKEMIVNDKQIKISDEMINVVEKKEQYIFDEIGHSFFDSYFGESGWVIRYFKEGESVYFYFINAAKWSSAGGKPIEHYDSTNPAIELNIPYEGGVLKVQFKTAKKT